MKTFATIPAAERVLYWRNYAVRKGVPEFIVEKDFWVCWLLGRIFATPQLGAQCVFKGGTSLSKVFHAIYRFSEDIDLGLSPASLGWNEADLDEAPSTSQRQKRARQLQTDCAAAVEKRFLPELDAVATACLGPCPGTGHWLRFELEAASQSPRDPLSLSKGSPVRLLHRAPRQAGVRLPDRPTSHRHTHHHTARGGTGPRYLRRF